MKNAIGNFIGVVFAIVFIGGGIWFIDLRMEGGFVSLPYVGDAVGAVQSVGMSTQQMLTAGVIIFILIWALSSLRTGNGKGGTK